MPLFFNWQAATKILARQLVRLRQQIANLQGSRAQIRGIATHSQVDGQIFLLLHEIPFGLAWLSHFWMVHCHIYLLLQAMHAQSSVAVGMKGATKAMSAINKVWIVNMLTEFA